MKAKRTHLITLLLAAGIFTNYAIAEQEVNQIQSQTSLSALTQMLERGQQGSMILDTIQMFQGELSNHDEILIEYLVEANMYNRRNADFFVRSITQREVKELIKTINDENLDMAIRAAAITQFRL